MRFNQTTTKLRTDTLSMYLILMDYLKFTSGQETLQNNIFWGLVKPQEI